MSDKPFRYTDLHGVEHTVSTKELKLALSSGKVAPSTLVWRDGMKEWAPAFTLPELSGAAIAAARSARTSVAPIADEPTKVGASAPRPRSIPPPVPKRPSSMPPPLPRRVPRAPMRTLTGIEPPEVLAALGINLPGGNLPGSNLPSARDPKPEQTSTASAVTLGDARESFDSGEDGWGESESPSIPKAPAVPKEAAALPALTTPTTPLSRRVPSIPPPPLPANPTPSPPKVGVPAVPHRATLMGLPRRNRTPAPQLKRSGPPPAPKHSAPPIALDATQLNLKLAPSRPPPPPRRRGESQRPPPRPQKTLEMQRQDTPSQTLVDDHLGRDAGETKTALSASPNALSMNDGRAMNREGTEIMELSAESRQEITDVMNREVASASAKKGSAEPNSEAASANAEEKAAEDKAAKDRATEDSAAEDEAAGAEAEGSLPLRRAQTLEMELSDHQAAAEAEPAPPSVEAPPRKRKKRRAAEETTTTFQVDRRGIDPLDEPEPRVPSSLVTPRKRGALEVPVGSLLAASAVWVIGLVVFFFVGRLSGFKSAGDTPQAKDGLADGFLTWQPPLDAVAAGAVKSEPKPCWVTRQPSRWAETASKTVPFDMRPDGDFVQLGFGKNDTDALGLRVDPKTGQVEQVFTKTVSGELVRVSPSGEGNFYVSEKGSRVIAPAARTSPKFLVYEKDSIGAVDAPEEASSKLWMLEGDDEVTADAFLATAPDAFFLVFRRGGTVYGGYFGADKAARGPLFPIVGSGGRSGKPKSGFNGTDVAVVFADQPKEEDARWQIRMARGAGGQVLDATQVVEVPAGGPGGDVIAPDLIGLKDGRWLLMWTEGTTGERAIRAQTYDSTMTPIGDPIALSPPAGNFGQAVLSVVGTYTTVAFLQAADSKFELWGAVLQCGS